MIRLDIKKSFQQLNKSYTLDLRANIPLYEVTAIYGTSGVGKTTLLKLLANLTEPDPGYLVPKLENCAMVFQDYALFPNMTVAENITFASTENYNITGLVHVFELESIQNKKPKHLSGGEQQRVAIARALAQEPDFLLLDEPFSALDKNIKLKIQQYLLDLQKSTGMTIILVSHNETDILKLSKSLLVIKDGKISSSNSPATLLGFCNSNTELSGEIIRIEDGFLHLVLGNNIVKIPSQKAIHYSIGDTVKFDSKTII